MRKVQLGSSKRTRRAGVSFLIRAKRIGIGRLLAGRQMRPRFVSNDRKYDVYIPYPYGESDNITIDLPDGFGLESADSPAPVKDKQGICSHETFMSVTKDGKTLSYKRQFSFGNNGYISFPVTSYPILKQLFEAFNRADVHQLTLKQGAVAATSTNQ